MPTQMLSPPIRGLVARKPAPPSQHGGLGRCEASSSGVRKTQRGSEIRIQPKNPQKPCRRGRKDEWDLLDERGQRVCVCVQSSGIRGVFGKVNKVPSWSSDAQPEDPCWKPSVLTWGLEPMKGSLSAFQGEDQKVLSPPHSRFPLSRHLPPSRLVPQPCSCRCSEAEA